MLRLIPVPAFEDNYLWLAVDAAGAAIAVDPGDAAPVLRCLRDESLSLQAILLTHHHADHIGGVAEILRDYPVDVYAPDDARITTATSRVHDGQRLSFVRPLLSLEVIAVPGHTRTHVAYHGDGILFCGDTLFSVGCGRLFEGTPAQMLQSLDRLAALPAETHVYCGHEYTLANCAYARTVEPGNDALDARIAQARTQRARGAATLPSTLADERATNPFLRVDAPSIVAWAEREHDIEPADRVARFAALRAGKDVFRAPPP